MSALPPRPEQFEFPWSKPEQFEQYAVRAFFVGDKRPRDIRFLNDGRPKKPAFGIASPEELE